MLWVQNWEVNCTSRFMLFTPCILLHDIKYQQNALIRLDVHESVHRDTTTKITNKMHFFFIFAVALRPNAGHGLLILEISRSHTTTHHSR